MTDRDRPGSTNTTQRRRGSAVVEFAVVLPVISMLLLGAIELGRGMMAYHALNEAANAAARTYSVRESTQAQANAMVTAAMANAGFSDVDYTVTFDPPTKSEINVPLEPVTVTVSLKFNDVAYITPDYIDGATLVGRCVMPADIASSYGARVKPYDLVDDDNPDDGFERDDDREVVNVAVDTQTTETPNPDGTRTKTTTLTTTTTYDDGSVETSVEIIEEIIGGHDDDD
ncbi:MAG: TadE/TadG family type IV pilus assembly protein [Planctomycetota bacterium]